MVLGSGFASFGDNLFGAGDSFLRFLLLNASGRSAGFFD
jgi:hypothetical protein